MIKGIVFNQAFWIQKTDDVANKLNSYDSLKAFHDTIMKQNNKTLYTYVYNSNNYVAVDLSVSSNGEIGVSVKSAYS